MTIRITSQSLSDYDAQLAYKTATAYLCQSDLASYLIDQLEHQHLKLTVEVSSDPATANKDTSNNGAIVWNLRSDLSPSTNVPAVAALLSSAPAAKQPYVASQWGLMHLLALACQQLNEQLNFRDADATWPWLDEKALSAADIEQAVASELADKPMPVKQDWNRLLNRE
ncbi:hypothetical protein AQS70_12225 [Pseudomonas endophytica]|uniref:Uncharacterized protein n=1 Tax=Pseudomonas endophytica TaxID=1563157 RepID=A0A0Q0XSF4_9PSED|nr:hypothetical protein [Pseudomonas endophytica]KQB52985.1 hypothetical protein AQS70_12225 [Pseudomonas endophytica]